jgi:peptide deformylase
MQLVPSNEIPKGQPVPVENLMDVYKTVQKMEKLCEQESGIGLSAVQVGIPWNLFIWMERGKFRYFINCEYEPNGDDKAKAIEGCLSLKNKNGKFRNFEVERHVEVTMRGKELVVGEVLSLADVELKLSGIYSVVAQHEIDHQRSILISDIGTEIEVYR